jgi:hypothetical protein
MIHTIFDTPLGFILASTSGEGVLVLARTLPAHLRDDYDGLQSFVKEGGIYVAAFPEMPGLLNALRVPLGWDGEAMSQGSVIRREEATAAVGDRLLTLCCHIAGELAAKAFTAWQRHDDERDAGLKAVLSRLPVGEA